MAVKVQKKPGTNIWYLVVHRHGKRTIKKIGPVKAKAEEAARELEKELALRDLGVRKERPKAPTLKDYYRTFKNVYITTATKPTTQAIYDNSFNNHILPVLGDKPLDEISPLDVQKLIAGLIKNKKLAKPSIRIVMSNLSTLYNHAIENEVVEKNPTYKASKLYKNAPTRTKEIQPLTEEEVPLFLEAVLKYSPALYELFLAAIHTGMRFGELAGLEWDDIDFESRYLMVKRQLVWGRIQTTKGGKSRRMDLSTALAEALKNLKRNRREEYLAKGENEIPKTVFLNQAGNPVNKDNVRVRHLHKCLKKAGLRKIRFHDLRHTFASLLIQNGENLAYVKEQLGHSSIKLTVDVYGHLVPGANRSALDRLPVVGSLAN